MLLNEGHDTEGKFFKSGLVGRYALTLENYAGSEWGNRFYSKEFLDGFCKKRNDIHKSVAKSTGTLVVSSTLLAFFQNIQGSIEVWGITVSVPEIGALALCVLVSLNFFVTIGHVLDQLIIDRFLNTLGSRIGAYSFELVLIDKTAQNLWVNALAPKYHGLSSGVGQKRAFAMVNTFYSILALAGIAFPISIVFNTFYSRIDEEVNFLEWVLVCLTIFIFLFSLLIIVVFCLNFKFRSSGLSEPEDPFVPESFLEMGHPRPNELKEEGQA